MDFRHTSRRDDLYSLTLMMFYMLNDLNLPGLDKDSVINVKDDARKMFKVVK